ncbi:MAG: hypothetical protein CMM10_12550 [Rhodospirillaceae bacterium]|nr:hypothetical protein [Rhodospirillaceae bacterium]
MVLLLGAGPALRVSLSAIDQNVPKDVKNGARTFVDQHDIVTDDGALRALLGGRQLGVDIVRKVSFLQARW